MSRLLRPVVMAAPLRPPRRLCVLALLALAAAFHGTVAAQETGRLVIAMMRADGVMLPFAAFDGRRWQAPWPVGVQGIELPATVDDVPDNWWGGRQPASWRLFPQQGEPIDVKPSTSLVIFVGRERRLGLRTDRAGATGIPPYELPFPKTGIVIGGEASIEPIPSVSLLAPRSRELAASLREDIDRAEQKAIEQLMRHARWKHPISPEQRSAVAPELEAWYSTPLAQPGFGVSYLEAVKKYPPGPEDEGCGLETFVRGWVHHHERRPGELKTDLTATVTYCDRAGVSYMLPLGRIVAQGRTHWIVQLSGWDHEWYAVARFEPQRVTYVVEYPAGSAPDRG